MKVWWCNALGRAWDMGCHNLTPCEYTREQYGDSPGEHDRCGPMRLIPDNAFVIEGDTAFSIHFEPSEQHYYIEIAEPVGETP